MELTDESETLLVVALKALLLSAPSAGKIKTASDGETVENCFLSLKEGHRFSFFESLRFFFAVLSQLLQQKRLLPL